MVGSEIDLGESGVTHRPSNSLQVPTGPGSRREAGEAELKEWVSETFDAEISGWRQISGGNRCRSWLVDLGGDGVHPARVYLRYQPPRAPSAEPYTVWREAQIYRAIERAEIPAPHLLAVHPDHQAIVTTAAPGRADFRRLADDAQKRAITADFVLALAGLHARPVTELDTGDLVVPATIADCVRQELAIWAAMYAETGRKDPLIIFALDWLNRNLPDPAEPPVLVHGDAGPGNFLFDGDRVSGLVDWELAHPGDPIEDLAWFCMRSVMEPVPDFAQSLADYERAAGRKVDRARLLYHRVFVSARVVIIRHRNVTGLPGNSIVSKALNRRLLVDALASAAGVQVRRPEPIGLPPTERTALYDGIVDDLRSIADTAGHGTVEIAKSDAKVVKYLREYDRFGAEVEQRIIGVIAGLLGQTPTTLASADAALITAIEAGTVDFAATLQAFAEIVAHEAQLAAPSSGNMARRGFPALDLPA